jgi:hypothetical protein
VFLSTVVSSVVNREAAISPISSDEPSPFVDIELHQPFVSHLQQDGLASFFIHDVGASHDFVDFEWFFAERVQDIFAIVQHD